LTYSLFIERRAQHALARIARPEQERIITAIRRLMDDPRPSGTKKLTGRDAWRIRIGDYRVIYEIHTERLLILVVEIGHRREIYK